MTRLTTRHVIHENTLARSCEYMQNILTYCLHRFHERKRERDGEWERYTFISTFTCECWAISLQIQACLFYVLCILYHYIIYLYNIYRHYILPYLMIVWVWRIDVSLCTFTESWHSPECIEPTPRSLASTAFLVSSTKETSTPAGVSQLHTTAWMDEWIQPWFNQPLNHTSLAFSCGIHFHLLVLPAVAQLS